MHPSTALATVLVDELILGGVTDVVLCPGSRNAPLSMALHAADAAHRLRLHVRIDERTAGFLALGLGRGSGRPAAVVTTSGTAVANLHPAVLEAHHGGVPLVVLSADRPAELRDVGANQVIDQRTVFGPALRFFHEYGVPVRRPGQQGGWRAVLSRALGLALGAGSGLPGPVQLNVPLVEPLLPAPAESGGPTGSGEDGWPESLAGRDGPWTVVADGSGSALGAGPESAIPAPGPGERVLFVADLTHRLAGPLARLGHPVISEAGGAVGSQVLSAGLHLLADPEFVASARPDRVIVLGRPTMYRQVAALLADDRVWVDVVAPAAGYADPSGRVRRVAPNLARVGEMSPETGDVRFQQHWQGANAAAAAAVAGVVAELDLGSGPRLAADLVAALPSGATLVLGSSQPPRDVGLAAAPRDGLRLLANRGVAGIDGMISTATGIALAGPGPTVALLGDLTFLHDSTGLIIGPHEPRPDLVLVVANNDGGGIFHTLEPGQSHYASAFERVFGTPHGVQLAGLVEACGAAHLLISGADELTELLADLTDTSEAATGSGITVVEVAVSRTELVEQHRRISAAARAPARDHAASVD